MPITIKAKVDDNRCLTKKKTARRFVIEFPLDEIVKTEGVFRNQEETRKMRQLAVDTPLLFLKIVPLEKEAYQHEVKIAEELSTSKSFPKEMVVRLMGATKWKTDLAGRAIETRPLPLKLGDKNKDQNKTSESKKSNTVPFDVRAIAETIPFQLIPRKKNTLRPVEEARKLYNFRQLEQDLLDCIERGSDKRTYLLYATQGDTSFQTFSARIKSQFEDTLKKKGNVSNWMAKKILGEIDEAYASCLLTLLHAFRQHRFVHGDLHSGNILVSKEKTKGTALHQAYEIGNNTPLYRCRLMDFDFSITKKLKNNPRIFRNPFQSERSPNSRRYEDLLHGAGFCFDSYRLLLSVVFDYLQKTGEIKRMDGKQVHHFIRFRLVRVVRLLKEWEPSINWEPWLVWMHTIIEEACREPLYQQRTWHDFFKEWTQPFFDLDYIKEVVEESDLQNNRRREIPYFPFLK